MRILIVFFLYAATLASAQTRTGKTEKSDKLEVPSAVDLAKAELTIKDLFRAEFASKKKADIVELAQAVAKRQRRKDQSASTIRDAAQGKRPRGPCR